MNPSMKQLKRWSNPYNITRPDNAALITELRYCRGRLNRAASTYNTGICGELSDNQAGRYLRGYVMAQVTEGLYGPSYLAGWISNRYRLDKWNTKRGWKRARLMWIDWMIASLENREYQP